MLRFVAVEVDSLKPIFRILATPEIEFDGWCGGSGLHERMRRLGGPSTIAGFLLLLHVPSITVTVTRARALHRLQIVSHSVSVWL